MDSVAEHKGDGTNKPESLDMPQSGSSCPPCVVLDPHGHVQPHSDALSEMHLAGSSSSPSGAIGASEVGEALLKIASRKFLYPPFSAKCQQEIQRWITLYSQENTIHAMSDADIRKDLVRILHEGCLAFCEELADDFINLGLRSQVGKCYSNTCTAS
jgi:hypothetical protein